MIYLRGERDGSGVLTDYAASRSCQSISLSAGKDKSRGLEEDESFSAAAKEL